MIKKSRYQVVALPVIPADSQFMINGKYAFVDVNDILFLYHNVAKEWMSTEMTLDKYANYWEKTLDEYTPHEFIQRVWGSSFIGKDMHFFYNPKNQSYVTSYNKPVKKGTDKDGLPILKAGETRSVCSHNYPQIIKFIQILGNFSLYEYEDKLRETFEQELLTKGVKLPEYSKSDREYYYDYDSPNYNVLFRDYCNSFFCEVLGIELKKDD